MKNTAWQKIKPYIFSVIVLALCVVLSCGSVVAWFYYSRTVGAQNIKGDKFGTTLTLSIMRNSAWEDVSSDASTAIANLDFGEMNNLNQLPSNSRIYFQAEVKLTTPTATNWFLNVDNVVIQVWKAGASEAEVAPYSATAEGVGDYFSRYKYLSVSYLISDSALTFYEVVNDISSFSTSTAITTKGQSICREKASDTQYVYFFVEVNSNTLPGLQQLIKDIKVSLMPYYLNLVVTISAKSVLGTSQEAQV